MSLLWMPVRSAPERIIEISFMKLFHINVLILLSLLLFKSFTQVQTFLAHNVPIRLKEVMKDLKHTSTLQQEFLRPCEKTKLFQSRVQLEKSFRGDTEIMSKGWTWKQILKVVWNVKKCCVPIRHKILSSVIPLIYILACQLYLMSW